MSQTTLDRGIPRSAGRDIIGTRTILAHAYFRVDQDIVGNIVTSHVSELRAQRRAILDGTEPSDPDSQQTG